MLAVAYFAALLARSADRWTARDADLDQIEDVAGLVEFMREFPQDEDEEDDEEDPRLFISDVAAASRSAYGELLLSVDLAPIGPDGRPAEAAATAPAAVSARTGAGSAAAAAEIGIGTGAGVEDDDEVAEALAERPDLPSLADADPEDRRPLHSGPAGDPDLLADFGVRATKLVGLCGTGVPPAEALADLAEALGAADELEEVR